MGKSIKNRIHGYLEDFVVTRRGSIKRANLAVAVICIQAFAFFTPQALFALSPKNLIENSEDGLTPIWLEAIQPAIVYLDSPSTDQDTVSRIYALIRFYSDAAGNRFDVSTTDEGAIEIPSAISADSNFIVIFTPEQDYAKLVRQIGNISPAATTATSSEFYERIEAVDNLHIELTDQETGNIECAYIVNSFSKQNFPTILSHFLAIVSDELSQEETKACLYSTIPHGFGVASPNMAFFGKEGNFSQSFPYVTTPAILNALRICKELQTSDIACWEKAFQSYQETLTIFNDK